MVHTPLTGRTGIVGPGAAAGAAVSIGAPGKTRLDSTYYFSLPKESFSSNQGLLTADPFACGMHPHTACLGR